MAGGIKTYPAGAEKKLFAGPRRPNTACVLSGRCPRSSPVGHKI